ncbi:MAG: helix-turn-helix domain-containing protein [Pseudomonadota bacterium]
MKSPNSPSLDPFVAAVDVIGDAWTFLITREAFFGASKFDDFASGLKISSSRLTERLKHLVALGLFERKQYQASPPRFEYRFTSRGFGVYAIALSMIAWGQKWRSAESDVELVHASCGKPIVPKYVCRDCGEEIRPQELIWPPIIPLHQALADETSVRGWRKLPDVMSVAARKDPATEVLKVAGDRWSMLIMYGALQREFRFREAHSKLGIAHNILSSRLKALVSEGLLEREDAARQAPYRATKAGKDLLSTVLVTRTWALDHLIDQDRTWNQIIHTPCGSDLRVDIQCAHCGEVITPQNVIPKLKG